MTVAFPATTGAVSVGPPLMVKVTVPVGVPEPGATGATLAVKVTAWPDTDGFGDDETVVVLAVLPGRLVWVPVSADGKKLESPL
ncbi:hypothetical protein [Streptomyces sp. NPDC047108]|uniref:hypothetical protein n=1 Tax=Streptomyces sp. NPDC047108 TaxID=3155025 RepID=UPI0033F49081